MFNRNRKVTPIVALRELTWAETEGFVTYATNQREIAADSRHNTMLPGIGV